MSRAYIGLGSNVGDRTSMLRGALGRLAALGRVDAVSSLYETEPWGKTDQPLFLNAACALETDLGPEPLLRELLRIEAELGRERSPESRWGPRSIDLDLLLYDERELRLPGLVVPHPRLHERAFALVPLAEIAPEAIHPALHARVKDLAERVARAGVRKLSERLASPR